MPNYRQQPRGRHQTIQPQVYSNYPRESRATRQAHARGYRQFQNYDTSAIKPQKKRWPKVVGTIIALLVVVGLIIGAVMLFKSCSNSGEAGGSLPEGKQVAFAGIGAFLTWFVYALLFDAWQSNFLATLAGAVFVAAYAQLMARVNKAPATIFLTTTVFPLVPGPNLYYMMYWIVGRNYTAAMQEAITLILTCLGIVFGFLIIEILSKYSTLNLGKLKKSQ